MARDQTDQRMILADKRIPPHADPPSAYPFPHPLTTYHINHPRTLRQAQGKFPTTNLRRMPALFVIVTPFVDGNVENKGGPHGA